MFLKICEVRYFKAKTLHTVFGQEKKMEKVKYIYWKDDKMWLGYLEEYPDYLTQGETLEELKENLKDIYRDVSSGKIPYVRRVDELEVA
jgi:hypothetical protein